MWSLFPRRPAAHPGSAGSILLVEPDVVLAATLAQVLQDRGYPVTVAGDPAAALHLAGRARPALIVLDTACLTSAPPDLLATLDQRRWDIPVVLLGPAPNPGGLWAGVVDRLERTVPAPEFLARIARYLRPLALTTARPHG